ncbi:hypothetical protein ATE62_05710 [Sphingopyxis sp. HIX]|uniref:hypothetical protein n=2 Tax=unclassified Sphingopyxis TaxID=2614943 RepID=UPI00073718C0|nr:hypothetical protein [Sphingopyxis sp. HIX]KTE41909.1 hypothetical protein ATE62_05710 [Sphingopyxis sp. HIX]KTE83597.1 hypothetical protein ATE72_13050 [Sphingopyxis sp. HXXIV]
MMRHFTSLALIGLLAACKLAADSAPAEKEPAALPVPEAKADGPAAATTAIGLDGEGLRFVDKATGKTSLLAFGVPRAQAEEALARVMGKESDRSSNAECGAGPMDFTRYDAMTLNFQDGKFAGWFLGNEPGADQYSTMSGIAVGTPRAKAAGSATIVMAEDSTLGEEFSIGEGEDSVGGMFAAPGDDAKIDALFAGVNCFFR